jgi:hypothetical protein
MRHDEAAEHEKHVDGEITLTDSLGVVRGTDHTPDLEITSLLAGGGIADSNGVAASLSGMFNQPTGLSVNSPLTVTSVVADASGEVGSGDVVHITVTLNKPLTLTLTGGDPTLTLNDGATATYAWLPAPRRR